MRKRKRLFTCVLFLGVMLVAAMPLASKPQGSTESTHTTATEAEDADEPLITLNLSVELTDTGHAAIAAYFHDRSNNARELKPAIAAALHCELKDKYRAIPGGYSGVCALPLAGVGLLHTYRLSTAPLVSYAKEHGIKLLTITISLPETQVRETVPAVASVAIPNPRISKAVLRQLEGIRSFTWKLDTAVPEAIEVRIGYSAGGVQQSALLLIAALLIPIFVAFWLRRRALAASAADKSAIWFSYLRCQQWLLNGALLLWWASEQTVRLDALISFLITPLTPLQWLGSAVSVLVIWLAPAVVWILCVLISHPVQAQLRGLHWTKKELALQAAYSLGSALFPLLLGIHGIAAVLQGNFRAAVLWIFGAIILKVIASTKLLKLLGMQPQALTSGELRDAAFGMAQRLGVKLQQIFVIPAGKGQMANAFARKGNTIAFTDYLLLRMTRREVNYVLAHELSHLRLKHPQKLSYAILGNLAAAIAVTRVFSAELASSYFIRYAVVFTFVTAGTYFWSRRFEFSADRGAVEATGDPQGAISALYKLAALNMHPLQWGKWSEKWLTHPSCLRRATAIATRAAIPLDALPEIAEASMREDRHYDVPPTTLAGNKVLTTTKKMRNTLVVALAMLAAIILTPTAFALLIKYAHFTAPVAGGVYVAGLFASVLAYIAVVNFSPGWRLRPIIADLRAKLEQERLPTAASDAIAVGLAPGALPRTFEGHSHWDLGFLFLREDRICYWGEEAKFALRRDQITGIVLGPGTPNLLRTHRIYIAWRDAERGASGAFSFGSAEPATLRKVRRQTDSLYRQLAHWRIESGPTKLVLPQLDSLRTPQFGQVTCVSPLANRKPRKILKQIYLIGLLAAGVAVVAELPFHVTQMMMGALGSAGTSSSSPGAGWYVVAVTVAVLLLQYVPYFFYKDNPVVRTESSAPPRQSSTHSREQEPDLAVKV